MWNVFPKFFPLKILLIIYTYLCFLLYADLIKQGFISENSTSIESASYLSGLLPIFFIILAWSIGQFGWKIFWVIPGLNTLLNKNICPDLNGKWVGEIESNREDEEGRIKKPVTLKIVANLFVVKVTLESDDQYARSSSSYSKLTKDPDTGNFQLHYGFEGTVPNPTPGDTSNYSGSAKLDIIFTESNEIRLQGVYWTNRLWHRGENTAGTINLTSVK